MTRFDTRLTAEQKAYFEQAARLGGFKTLSEFILSSAKVNADRIVEQHKQILATDEDQSVFFRALMNPKKPNARLKKAAERYRQKSGK